jgi:dipeptidyl aminopeptidase/acylaminoacyl peptidase
MKKIIFTLSVMIIIVITPIFAKVNRYKKGNLVIENIPEIPQGLIIKLQPYLNTHYASFLDWLPYEKGILIRTRLGDVSQIHKVEHPKAFRQQLTFFKEPVSGGIVCPDFKKPYFLFTKDSAGDELRQIYKFNYETGAYQRLTDGKSRHSAIIWSNKGDKFAFSSTRRNGKDYDIYLGTLKGKLKYRCILKKKGWWGAVDFSADDQNLIVEHYISANESYYYILNIKNKKLVQINPVEQKISYGKARWAKNGKGIYLISDQPSDFKQLIYYDVSTGKTNVLTKQIPWDIENFEISPSGDTIAFLSNEDGITKLYFFNTQNHSITQARLPDGLLYGLKFKPDGTQLAFVINSSKSPSDVYSLNLKNKTFIRWTYSEVGGLNTNTFIPPELIRYETFDSVAGKPKMIPAFYYRPKKFKPPYPVLIICHGGPEGQYLPYFSSLTQFYLNEMGSAVIAPNVRGSSGYGKDFIKLDNGYNREKSIKDIGALLDWIEEQPELDAVRVAVTGGSYGGYMVLASMTHYSERLCCGIDFCGISNFVTFLENTGKYRQDLRRAEYGDERDPEMREFLNKISPLTNAHKITKPLLIIQGLNDPRVPVTEAEQIVKAVRKNGVNVWFLLAEDEGHGFGKKPNRDFANQAEILFLEKYLFK